MLNDGGGILECMPSSSELFLSREAILLGEKSDFGVGGCLDEGVVGEFVRASLPEFCGVLNNDTLQLGTETGVDDFNTGMGNDSIGE